MRSEPNTPLDRYRRAHPQRGMTPPGVNYGWFEVPIGGSVLRVMSSGSSGEVGDWEHVSVSLVNRCPSWREMEKVRELFWDDSECVVQFSPPRGVKVNHHKYCLHLWRQIGAEVEMPPLENV